MGKSEIRKQLKKAKIIDGFESAGYEVIEWYIDPVKNSCVFILVKNKINNIEFLCLMPYELFHIPIDEGVYVYLDRDISPDVEDATSMWNECGVDKLFLKLFDKIAIKNGKNDYDVYSVSDEKPDEDDIKRYANELNVLEESDESDKTSKAIIIAKRNPFDILVDGGTFEKVESHRVEDIQPCVLVEYNGYSMGQAIPVVEFGEFFKTDNIANNINKIAKTAQTIYDFQNDHIQKLFEEAIDMLDKYSTSVKKSYEEYTKEIEEADKDFAAIQVILEKQNHTYRSNEIVTKAHNALRELLSHRIERRDAIIGLLEDIREVFGQM